jgi:hypothetical protein
MLESDNAGILGSLLREDSLTAFVANGFSSAEKLCFATSEFSVLLGTCPFESLSVFA